MPLFRSNNYLENFVLIHIENHDDIKGTIIIDYTIHPKDSDDMIIKFQKNLNQMITFKKDLPIISVYLRLKTTLIDIEFYYIT